MGAASAPTEIHSRGRELIVKALLRGLPWIAPGGLVLAGTIVWIRVAPGPEAFVALTVGFPYAAFGTAVFVAWRFHRSRVVAAIVAIAILDRISQALGAGYRDVALQLGGVALPLTLATLSALKDRGIVTTQGLSHLAGVVAQVPLLAIALVVWPSLPEVARATVFDPGLSEWTTLPQLPLVVFALSFVALVTTAILRRQAVEQGLPWVLLAVFLALTTQHPSPLSTVYFLSGTAIAALSVVETSYTLAYNDELTGLPSRRAMPQMQAYLGDCYSIAMVDIDHFKSVNDQYGHDVGDQVLRMVASHLNRVTGGARVFRYGGEEFTLVFPGQSVFVALPHLEKLRKSIESATFTLRRGDRPSRKPETIPAELQGGSRKTLQITVSIGVADRGAEHTAFEAVLEGADQALYRAKRAGRNRVSR